METKYQCECGAEDSDHQNYTTPPPALFCWKCGAGRGMPVVDQIRQQIGMLQKQEDVN